MNHIFPITKTFAGYLLSHAPQAVATIRGSEQYPNLKGIITFYALQGKTLVTAEVAGLPTEDLPCSAPIFGLHIHEGNACTSTAEAPFADTGAHFTKENCPHPAHTGDLPPLFGTPSTAWMAVLTDRFAVDEVIGRTVIIHSRPDDFTTQPSGNAGEKMACGVIERV